MLARCTDAARPDDEMDGSRVQSASSIEEQSNALRNCYTGLTVTHRSGIWGTVDAFGNVNGGSNWISAHLECRVGD